MNKDSNPTGVRLEQVTLEKPAKLRSSKCSPEAYQRLSVAYGLSFMELGEFYGLTDEDEVETGRYAPAKRGDYVGPEQV